MLKLVLVRLDYLKDRTLGRLEIYKDLLHLGSFVTLELPNKNNLRQVSCIPAGKYVLKAENHPTKGKCFRVLNVQGRDGVLLHRGNFPSDTLGCILPALRFEDIDHDGQMDVAASGSAMDLIWTMVPDTAELNII